MDQQYELAPYQEYTDKPEITVNDLPKSQNNAILHKGGPVKVCLKRPDGSMVEQTHLKVTHTKDGKFVINSNGQNSHWLGQGGPIRAILIDKKQSSVQLPPGTRLVAPAQRIAPKTYSVLSNGYPTSNDNNIRTVRKTPQLIKPAVPGAGKLKPIRTQSPLHPQPQQIPQNHCLASPTQLIAQKQKPHRQQVSHHLQPRILPRQPTPQPHLQTPQSRPQYRTPHTPNTPMSSSQWNNNSVLNGITSIGDTRKRYSPVDVKPQITERKRPRRSSERGGKGLRHFSSKVCEKVKSKGVTTYLEVSEELVAEFASNFTPLTPSCSSFDVKNIRRRVYDALNVLCAMNIISKDKKEIRWIGLPTNSLQECRALQVQKQETQQRIKEKKKRAQEYMLQLIAYRTLIQRNREIEGRGPLPDNSTIQVPFIILSTGPRTEIGLEVSVDKTKYEFTFNEMFEIHDEIAILKKMGLCYGLDTGEFTDEGLAQAERLLPKSAKPFLKELFPRKVSRVVEDTKPVVLAETPEQSMEIKREPQELSEVEKQALETYSFDAPTYSSAYTSYTRPDYPWEQPPAAVSSPAAAARETAANTLLSLTTVNQ